MPLRHLSTLLAAAWMAGIYYLSSQPTPDLDLGFSNQDKILHLGAYGLLSMLILGGMQRDGKGWHLRQIITAALLAALYGCCDEWHQSFVPGRMSDDLDLIADAIGALLGAVALQWFTRRSATASA